MSASTNTAELILTGGPVYTAGEPGREMRPAITEAGPATAVAVRAGRIAAVGTYEQIRGLAGPGTEVVSLDGRPVLPGFQDAHVHPCFAGNALMRCDLAGVPDAAAALERIRAYADSHPGMEWISGNGWRMDWFPGGTPARQALDSVVGGRPAYFTNRDAHGAWVSSRALELAGIDAATPDPADGRIERDAAGAPQGTLHEGAALLVGRLVPPLPLADQVEGLLRAQAHLHALGVTAWQDAIVGGYLGFPDPLPVYLAAAASGRLSARVAGALWWDRARGGEQVSDLLQRREQVRAAGPGGTRRTAGAGRVAHAGRDDPASGEFRAETVKIMQDGVAENFTAGMIEPYLDGCGCRTGNRGLSYVDPAALRAHVTELVAQGFGVHFHAIGDRAVRESLDAIEAARAAHGPGGGRHHIAHLQIVHPDDLPRFASLGVAATIQALWAAHEPQMDELTIPFIGPQRAGWQYPFASILRAGARLAAGSDWPVSSPDPLWAMHVAVNRTLPLSEGGAGAEPLLPEQALTLPQAAAAYTAGSAHVNNLDETGRVEPGMLADLVVLDRDPFAGPPDEIAATGVALTYVGGQRMFASPSA